MSGLISFLLGLLVAVIIAGVQWYMSALSDHKQRLGDFMRPPRECFLRLRDELGRDADARQLLATAQEAIASFESMLKAYRAEFPKSGIIHGLYWNIWSGMKGMLKRIEPKDDAAVRAKIEMLAEMGISTLEKVPTWEDFRDAV